jgi:hypothetical protein
MKATLENFLIKHNDSHPLWEPFIEWLNKDKQEYEMYNGESKFLFYGKINKERVCLSEHKIKQHKLPIITLEQWQQLLNPKTETMNNFKKGENVYVYPYGFGIFEKYYGSDGCVVNYNNIPYYVNINHVSFTEYTLEGFTQERPFEPVVGQMYYFWDEAYLQRGLVVYGRLNSIEDNPKYIYKIDDRAYYEFCSETNPLL